MCVANNVQNLREPERLGLNLIDHFMDLLKGKVRAQPLQLKHMVIPQTCVATPQQYIHRHILSGGCTKY